jgi:hypothetical protein
MKGMLISFAVGLLIGVVYGLLRVKSPAPPLVVQIDVGTEDAQGKRQGRDRDGLRRTKKIVSSSNVGTDIPPAEIWQFMGFDDAFAFTVRIPIIRSKYSSFT